MDLGKNIRRLREAKGWSPARLAEEAGLSTVRMIEWRGTAEQASLKKIAKALGVTIADLYAESKPVRRRKAG